MKKVQLCIFAFAVLMLAGCAPKEKKPLKIALSKATDNYINWIHRIDSTVVIVDLQGLKPDSGTFMLAGCSGIVFTGGEDVVPSRYGKMADTGRCETNPARDSLEFALIRKALKLKMPVLGICRGQQILNVALGGTLLVDIPTDYPSGVTHRCEDYTKCFHTVKIEPSSLLYELCKADTGRVTTNHHQAIERLGEGLRVSAFSPDGLPEAIEWVDPKDKGYFMAVQWHPERMPKGDHLSDPLARAFLQASIIYRMLK